MAKLNHRNARYLPRGYQIYTHYVMISFPLRRVIKPLHPAQYDLTRPPSSWYRQKEKEKEKPRRPPHVMRGVFNTSFPERKRIVQKAQHKNSRSWTSVWAARLPGRRVVGGIRRTTKKKENKTRLANDRKGENAEERHHAPVKRVALSPENGRKKLSAHGKVKDHTKKKKTRPT